MTHQRTLTAAHWGVYEVEYDDAGHLQLPGELLRDHGLHGTDPGTTPHCDGCRGGHAESDRRWRWWICRRYVGCFGT